jgi:DNA-directed RNA polymerase specialized sigma24 family protein
VTAQGQLQHHPDTHLVRAAVAREPEAVRALVARLTPEVQNAVASSLLRGRIDPGTPIRQEVEDLTQEVFLALFDRQGVTLLRWDPDGGMSLNGFVRLAARRLVISILRSRPRNPFQLKLMEPADFDDRVDAERPADGELMSRQSLRRLMEELGRRVSPQGLDMFCRLFAWQQSVEVVCQETGLKIEAVYQWRSRLRKLVQQIASEQVEA